MWTRSELKLRGKAAFKANYWKAVLVSLILMAITGAAGAASQGTSGSDEGSLLDAFNSASASTGFSVSTVTGIVAGILGVSLLISILIGIFVKNPLVVGCKSFFLNNSDAPAPLGHLGDGFSAFGYKRVIWTMFLQSLITGIGFILFLIPGLILTYSYRLVPYILAENPEISGMEALKLSQEMMRGQKWRTFVLDLSFILWGILTTITCGIAGIFYVQPYIYATDAELYKAIRDSFGGSSVVDAGTVNI